VHRLERPPHAHRVALVERAQVAREQRRFLATGASADLDDAVAAVIALVTLGSGASTKVRENLSKLGSNMLIVRPGQSTFGPGGTTDSRAFDERDVAALKANLSGIRGVAPTAQKQAKVVYGALNYDTSVTGTNTDWFTVQDWVIADGRAFTEGEVRSSYSTSASASAERQSRHQCTGL
jgi:putative ABC transport system permease protein